MSLETRLQSLRSQLSFYANMVTDSPGATVTQQQQRLVKNERLVELNKRIVEGESRLAALRELYTESYPDLRAATATLQTLKTERDILEKEEMAQMAQLAQQQQQQQESAKPVEVKKSLNPQMGRALEELKMEIAQVETSIRTKDLDIKQRMQQQVDLHAKIQAYQNRIDVSPINQQRYVGLMRDYDLAKEKFDEMSKRKSLSETATNMEDRKAGENLEVLDPASLPEAPTEPNRLIIAAAGTGIGFVLGVFLAGARELKDTSLKNLKDVRAYTNLAVLSSIPLLENALLVRRKRRLFWLAWTSAVIVGTIAMSGSMYYYYFGRS
jgi:uncharacterized protein involved in exopolysaccharide biosynthesis